MPRQTPEGCKGLYVEIPIALETSLKQLAEGNHRSVRDEVIHALERHLAVPPVVTVVTPALPAVNVQHTPKRRGRPPKARPAESAADSEDNPAPQTRKRK